MEALFREIVQEVTRDWTRLLAEVLQSLILLAILVWAVRRYGLKRLNARQARIVAELAGAEQGERDGARFIEEARSRIANAKQETQERLRAAEAEAQREREAALTRIEEDAVALIAQARQTVEREKDRVASEAASRLVSFTAEATRRYLDEMLTEAERRGLTQRAILASLEELSGSASPAGSAS